MYINDKFMDSLSEARAAAPRSGFSVARIPRHPCTSAAFTRSEEHFEFVQTTNFKAHIRDAKPPDPRHDSFAITTNLSVKELIRWLNGLHPRFGPTRETALPPKEHYIEIIRCKDDNTARQKASTHTVTLAPLNENRTVAYTGHEKQYEKLSQRFMTIHQVQVGGTRPLLGVILDLPVDEAERYIKSLDC